MRGSVRIKDAWQNVTLTDDPGEIMDWLQAQESRDAVCIDDKKQIYYCSTEELHAKYKQGGKKALMFIDLARKLHDQAPPSDGKDLPNYCNVDGDAWCSERSTCQGRRIHCGKETNLP